MKTFTFIFFLVISQVFADISTFNGELAHWGWFGNNPKAGDVSDPIVKSYLTKKWGKVHPFDFQAQIGNQNNVEFLWKITPDLVKKAEKSRSSYIVGGVKITSIVARFNSDGVGNVALYSGQKLVGRVNCQTSNKRQGKYSQLAAGDYKVLGKKRLHVSTEIKGVEMPFSILLDDVRKIYMHQGDISSIAAGCIRLSKPSARVIYDLVSEGLLVRVVHDP